MPVGLSLSALLAAGLALSAPSDAEARRPRKRAPPKKGAPRTKPTKDDGYGPGEFKIGDGKVHKTVIVNKGSCESYASASAWAEAADAWAKAVVPAVTYGCNSDLPKVIKYLEGELEATAYAAIWVDSYAKCDTQGAAVGCAASEAHAHAFALAAYDAFVKASAAADLPKHCPCIHDLWAESSVTIEAWGKIFAKVSGAVKSKVCAKNKHKGESYEASASLECVANASVKLWGYAIAGAWLKSSCGPDIYADAKCGAECEGKADWYPCKQKCKETAWGKARTFAEAYLNVIDKDSAYCDPYVDNSNAGPKGGAGVTKKDAKSGVKEGITGEQYGKCIAKAQTESIASSVSVFLGTFAKAMVGNCKAGAWPLCKKGSLDEYGACSDSEGYPKPEVKVAKAVADVYIDVLAQCNTYGEGTLGCAFSYATTEAIAKACARGWAGAWARARVGSKHHCNCKAHAAARADISSFFKAGLWSQVLAEAEAGLYDDSGNYCIAGGTDGTIKARVYADCLAAASVKLIQRAYASAYIAGDCTGQPAVCESCKHDPNCDWDTCAEEVGLYADAYVEIFQKAVLKENNGYCTGNKEGHYTYIDIDTHTNIKVLAGGKLDGDSGSKADTAEA